MPYNAHYFLILYHLLYIWLTYHCLSTTYLWHSPLRSIICQTAMATVFSSPWDWNKYQLDKLAKPWPTSSWYEWSMIVINVIHNAVYQISKFLTKCNFNHQIHFLIRSHSNGMSCSLSHFISVIAIYTSMGLTVFDNLLDKLSGTHCPCSYSIILHGFLQFGTKIHVWFATPQHKQERLM